MLWAKSEKDDPAFAHYHFGQRYAVFYSFFTAQPT